ncbi:MAG: hypothetical protein RL477_1992 [Pseudomonadota bacterium]
MPRTARMIRAFPAVAGLAACLGLALPAAAADLPQATGKMLAALKLDASILSGLDRELAVPQAWIDAAKQEKEVIIYTTTLPRQWLKIEGILKERYPYINFRHEEVNTAERRWVRPLAAFTQGRIITDVVMDMSGSVFRFREAGALIPLDNLPSYGNFPVEARQKDHIAVAVRSRYWCMSYNTRKIARSELPKTWDDLLTNPKFADKNLALVNRPNLWLLNVWTGKGDEWGRKYVRDLFALSPQLRKEGLTAVINLIVLGEASAAVPSEMMRVGPEAQKGAPIGFHCPEPVPFTISDMGIIAKSPRTNAARIFVNWFLSKEGQIAQYWANFSPPAHKELLRKEFLFYPEAIAGKKIAVVDDHSEELSKTVLEEWNKHWLSAGGPSEAKKKKKKAEAQQ